MFRWFLALFFVVVGVYVGGWLGTLGEEDVLIEKGTDWVNGVLVSPTASEASVTMVNPTPTPTLIPVPERKVLGGGYQVFQSFNNCGPASLSMALSYYRVNVSQHELGDALRPYQVASGDNDDKSVTLEELAEKSKEYGLVPYHRPNGNVELLKQLVTHGLPVITITWTDVDEDIGHYRVVKGFDEGKGVLIQDDSLQGKDLEYRYDVFEKLWGKFNYEYLVLVPEEKVAEVEQILGEDTDEDVAWEHAVELSEAQLAENPDDVYARFNLSVALFNTGKYQESVEEFEQVEGRLPFRTLWYQIEPIEAYFELGEYDRVMEISERILSNQNRAFSELYLLRGKVYGKRGEFDNAKNEYKLAVKYNSGMVEARDMLRGLE